MIRRYNTRNWPRYARALDMHLEGYIYKEIAAELGVNVPRARHYVYAAARRLAERVYNGKITWHPTVGHPGHDGFAYYEIKYKARLARNWAPKRGNHA